MNVVISAVFAKTWREKSQGLLGKQNAYALYFETRWGIHTISMKFPIDVVILDDQNRAAVLKRDLEPNRFMWWNPRYKKVLELPAGTIRAKKIVQETSIDLKFEEK